jgi:type IV pilus assembly protein PilB
MGAVSIGQIQEALARQRKSGKKIGEELVAMEAISTYDCVKVLADQHFLDLVDLTDLELAPNLISTFSREECEEKQLIPYKIEAGVLHIASCNPIGIELVDNFRFKLGMEIETCLADWEQIEKAINRNYESVSTLEDALGEEAMIDMGGGDTGDDDMDENDSQVIKLVYKLIADAVLCRASDVHLEPLEKKVRVRYRVDGTCHEVDIKLPKRMQGPVISRVKIMARLDIAEKRKPQDGQINFKMPKKTIDLRVSTLPAKFGESTVLRILDKAALKDSIEELGFSSTNFDFFQSIIQRPNGVFLVCGPTGSGKTTTLYGALNYLNRPDVKIITAEDPVEYHLTGINQCQVNHVIGYSFSRILRSMLRQAPNIILVGEIRDKETADIAIESALTGHFVFSTVHTNDAPSTMTRLIDIGAEPFQVASSVSAVLAQRLVKTICPHCKVRTQPDDLTFTMCDMDPAINRKVEWFTGSGCEECEGGGYLGRMAIHELMVMSREIMDLVFDNKPASHIRRTALLGGMVSLRDDAIEKARLGMTSLEEVIGKTTSDVDLLEGKF